MFSDSPNHCRQPGAAASSAARLACPQSCCLRAQLASACQLRRISRTAAPSYQISAPSLPCCPRSDVSCALRREIYQRRTVLELYEDVQTAATFAQHPLQPQPAMGIQSSVNTLVVSKRTWWFEAGAVAACASASHSMHCIILSGIRYMSVRISAT